MVSWREICVVNLLLVFGFVAFSTAAVGDGNGFQNFSFPAIYNFGDSNSDTGGISAAMWPVNAPNGETFFGKPSGRAGDGRLIIHFIAEKLQLPYLSPYLDSIGTNFRHGANFATGGSSIRPGGYSPFHLGIQISQFMQFKTRTTTLYSQLSPNRKVPPYKESLPRSEDFSTALYTFDIGQNDLSYGFQHSTEEQVRASIPKILAQFSHAVKQLYKEGARVFWVHNTGPIGCLPYTALYYTSKPGYLDRIGCVKPRNEIAQEFNRQLKNKVSRLRTQLLQAAFTYVDMYSVKYAVISDAKNQGFTDPMNFCCGSFYGYHINCGKKATVNGTVYGTPCNHPSRHISWDGIHYSEAANLWVANHILNGSFSDTLFSIDEACHHPQT
ncbi:GDSL esterase/lipase At3g27950-like [Tripterygium wilfordii]|uniref:GDSL esterase/lipase At3g27950-like n=1 Tax=Tripterygium wilfordii TaxID=458696 RepID=UPI0018F7F846|nr:GDSL esterase/lipase At3g27950-like [Tripterygium wilfordii]